MAYQALYRKYRPRRFEDVVGQNHITTILKNQIQTGRTAHAYLFCGSRGTGKTTTAKIFARAINCLSPVEGEACGQCEACGYMEADDVDIIEIDAASNNGVDDMRALIEQARFTPLRLTYKVYIIDEVHMLSNSASNALLKTLEEPPQHVKFLLATTEPQKLLATVVSRCQRFDFKRLGMQEIMRTLRGIVGSVGASMDEGALSAIARAADGGMRDALSLLDQCLAFCGDSIAEQDVYDVLGSMSGAFFFDLAGAMIAGDAQRALRMLEELLAGGRNLTVFVQDLAGHLRALLLAKVCGECRELLECTADSMEKYMRQAEQCTQPWLLRALDLAGRAQAEMKWLAQPRVLVEAMLVRMCRPEDESGLLALEERIAKLERKLAGGVPTLPAAQAAPIIQAAPAEAAVVQAAPAVRAVPAGERDTLVGAAEEERAAPQAQASFADAEPLEQTRESLALWEGLRKALQASNPSLYVLSAGAQSVALRGETLVVIFPEEKKENARVLFSPQKHELLQKALRGVAPGLRLHIQAQGEKQAEEADTQTEELLRVFGDKLSIEE